jgi:hypothetical protein
METLTNEQREQLRQINAVLEKLSSDEDLQDDFKLSIVKVAIDHWTGVKRLDPEKAQQLQHNRRVVYVLQRFQMLQSVCKGLGMEIPLNHLLLGRSSLEPEMLPKLFRSVGQKYVPSTGAVPTTSLPSRSHRPDVPVLQHEENVQDCAQKGASQVQEQESSKLPQNAEVGKNANKGGRSEKDNEKMQESSLDINSIIKIAIAICFVLIAITVSHLLK